MREDAYRQYDLESQNWLMHGRARLLGHLVAHAAETHPIEHILEVGAGVGQNLATLAKFGNVDAAEIEPIGIERIREHGIVRHLYTDRIPFAMERPYDVICALDVLEHLDDDRGAWSWISDGLRPGGHSIVSVPAYQWLFSDHDRALEHRRRYSKRSLLATLPPELEIVRAGYFNTLLFPAAVASRMLGGLRKQVARTSDTPTKQQSSVPDPVDRVLRGVLEREAALFVRRPIAPFGLSVFVLARRRP